MSAPWRRATICPLCTSTQLMRPTKVGAHHALRCAAGHTVVAVVAGADGMVPRTTPPTGPTERKQA